MTAGGERGASLLEVAVALLLLDVGALALAAGIGAAERARGRAWVDGRALAAAEAWLEAWRAEPLPSPGAGRRRVGGAEIEWTVEAVDGCRLEARLEVRPGPGGGAAWELATRRHREGVACGP